MYIDYILFAVGGILILAAAVLAIILLKSRKSSREFRRTLAEDKNRLDIISTLRSTQVLNNTDSSLSGTETLTDNIRRLQNTEPLVGAQSTELLAGSRGTMPLVGVQSTELLSSPQNIISTTETDSGELPADSVANNKTELLVHSETEKVLQKTELLVPGAVDLGGLDISVLAGKYDILREIRGGGMSRIFLARHAKLGNEWIVKFVEGKHAELANEAEVLKKLNHISLPQIIDIFQDSQGTFLVERYIEGCSLEEALRLGQQIKEGQICDWGIQLSQVLSYLHNLETPIIHCDMKPSNVMLTHDDRLVLIDFGISKRQGITDQAIGITLRYAAPEQFQGRSRESEAVRQRFGTLPPEQRDWRIDERTDLFSVGVILYELMTGVIPTTATTKDIYKYATPKMADAISKCLELNPDKRFQTAAELTAALEKVKNQRVDMARKLVMRRVAAACCAAALVGGIGSTASAAYINQIENLSMVDMDPGRAVVTAQQSVQVLLQKVKPNGEVVILEPDKIQWSYSDDNIARIDGDRLVGLNVGETTLYGKYRNKIVSMDISVTEPIEELVDIALRYPDGVEISTFLGNGEREHVDGDLSSCSFVSPEYMSGYEDVVYVSDSGLIRVIEDGEVYSIPIEPEFLTADRIRAYQDDLYVITGAWEADDDSYYGILKISDDAAEFLYYTEAGWSTISDFAFSSDGTLWFVQQNLGTGKTGLFVLDTENYESVWQMELPDGASRMTFDEADNLYISVPDQGVILRVDAGADSWAYFAGVEGERHFIDGVIPSFYRPTALAAKGDALYVLDFDTVRKVTVEGKGALYTETLAGVPEANTNPTVVLGSGNKAKLAASDLASLIFDNSGQLLLSDPKNSAVYALKEL